MKIIHTLSLWYDVCMKNVKADDLSKTRSKIGAICFFIGSIQIHCKNMKLDGFKWVEIMCIFFLQNYFQEFGHLAANIFMTYYKGRHKVEFATISMKQGAAAFLDWYYSSFPSRDAVDNLVELIRVWNKQPEMKGDEIYLLKSRELFEKYSSERIIDLNNLGT